VFFSELSASTPCSNHLIRNAQVDSVDIEPGARMAGHPRPIDQTLIATAGWGQVQPWVTWSKKFYRVT
jgi:quercetin dioxygenase-like cupin family protein